MATTKPLRSTHRAIFDRNGRRVRCDGCKHNLYSAPGGQKGLDYPWRDPILLLPHSRCTFFAAYIPMIVERKRGCDGTCSNDWIASDVPDGCPTFPDYSKEDR